jgi:hypothetical protein
MKGYVEIIRNEKKGDQISIFLQPTPQRWYYFNYKAGFMYCLSSNDDDFNNKIVNTKEKDRVTAKYSLEGVLTPIGIADYALEKFLPADFASDLPDIEAIETDQTRRLQLILEKRRITATEGPNLRHL